MGEREAPVRALMDALNKRASKERAYTTDMTIMARLHKKKADTPARRRALQRLAREP